MNDTNLNTPLTSTRADALRFQFLPVLGHMAVASVESVLTAEDEPTRRLARKRLSRVLAELRRRGSLPISDLKREEEGRVEAFIAYAKRKKAARQAYVKKHLCGLGKANKGSGLIEYSILGAVGAVALGGLFVLALGKAHDISDSRVDILSLTQPAGQMQMVQEVALPEAPRGPVPMPMAHGPLVVPILKLGNGG